MTDYNSHAEITELVNSTCDKLNIPHVAWQFNNRFTRKLGLARVEGGMRGSAFSVTYTEPRCNIYFSRPLWLRATVEERRQVIIHEVCHIATFHRNGRMTGHDRVWRSLMIFCGVAPKRCHNVDRTGLARKNRGSENVTCGCPGVVHSLGKIRCAKLRAGRAVYTCKRCKQPVKFTTQAVAA